MKYYKADSEHVKFLGRTLSDNGLLWCFYSGTGASFTFCGTKLEITTVGDSVSEQPNNTENYARIGIYVNGARVVDSLQDQQEKTFSVWENCEPQTVRVDIIKLSEAAMSGVAIKLIGVEADDEIKPVEEKGLYIEFIGDSITCGYGIDDEDRNHHFSTATEDVTRGYAYRTAQELNADYSMVALSGYGIISGHTVDGETKIPEQIMPLYYDKLGFSYGSFQGRYPQDYKWNFEKKKPDFIVINLGTNDDSYSNDNIDRQDEFCVHYTQFLKEVKKLNGNCPILCMEGTMGDRLYPFVEKAVSEYINETGDQEIIAVRFEPQKEEDGYVADWHPSALTHEKTAVRLKDEILRFHEF